MTRSNSISISSWPNAFRVRNIVLRRAAECDLRSIADYTEAEYGTIQAKRYIDDIWKAIGRLAEFPGIGSKAVGLPAHYRKIVSGMHRVIYRDTDDAIIVVRMIHASEDVPDVIEEHG